MYLCFLFLWVKIPLRVTAPRFELTSQRQKVSRLPTEPPGRPVCKFWTSDLWTNQPGSRRRKVITGFWFFSGLNAWTVCFFTVHKEYLGAVALRGCTPRGDHTHCLLASYFLVRSSTALLVFVYFQANTGVS